MFIQPCMQYYCMNVQFSAFNYLWLLHNCSLTAVHECNEFSSFQHMTYAWSVGSHQDSQTCSIQVSWFMPEILANIKKKNNSLEMIHPRHPKTRNRKLLKIRNRPHFISKIYLVLTSVYVLLTHICLPISLCKWWLSKQYWHFIWYIVKQTKISDTPQRLKQNQKKYLVSHYVLNDLSSCHPTENPVYEYGR